MKKKLSQVCEKRVCDIGIVKEALLQQDTDRCTSDLIGETVQLQSKISLYSELEVLRDLSVPGLIKIRANVPLSGVIERHLPEGLGDCINVLSILICDSGITHG